MRKIILAATMLGLAAPLAVSTTAQAQSYRTDGYARDWNDRDRDGRGWDRETFWRGAPASTWERMAWIKERLDRGRADGTLNNREYWRGQSELRRIRQMAWRLKERDGGTLTRTDAGYIQDRLDQLSQQVRWDRRD